MFVITARCATHSAVGRSQLIAIEQTATEWIEYLDGADRLLYALKAAKGKGRRQKGTKGAAVQPCPRAQPVSLSRGIRQFEIDTCGVADVRHEAVALVKQSQDAKVLRLMSIVT